MKNKLLALIALCGATSSTMPLWAAWEDPQLSFVTPDLEAIQKGTPATYYVYHVASGQFMSAGADYGTTFVIASDGQEVTISYGKDYQLNSYAPDNAQYSDAESYRLSMMNAHSNGGFHEIFLDPGGRCYVDHNQTGHILWDIMPQEGGTYRICVNAEDPTYGVGSASGVTVMGVNQNSEGVFDQIINPLIVEGSGGYENAAFDWKFVEPAVYERYRAKQLLQEQLEIADERGFTDYADYPFTLPEKRVDFSQQSLYTGLNLLSFGKTMTASTWQPGHEAASASDENIKTWWAASSGHKGEYLQIDLRKPMEIAALQVCFADEGSQTYRSDKNIPIYRYTVEYSPDAQNWHSLADRSQNDRDQIYELITLDRPVTARFVRVSNASDLIHGKFSITDLRLFGTANGTRPEEVKGFTAQRHENRQRMSFSWQQVNTANGYVIRWGTSPSRIDQAMTVYGTNCEVGFFDKEATYYATIEAFNESGKGKRSKPIKIN